MTTKAQPITQVYIPARTGKGIVVKRKQRLKVTALQGTQIGDLFAFVLDTMDETLSPGHTRSKLGQFYFKVGDYLYSNQRNPLLLVEEDMVGVHDMLAAACDPQRYEESGMPDHRSCRQNLIEAVREMGYDPPYLYSDPVNLFQNSPVVDLAGHREIRESPARAGDYIILQAMVDLLAVVSACPSDMTRGNGGNPTDMMLEVYA